MSRGMRLQSMNQLAAMGLKEAGTSRHVDTTGCAIPRAAGQYPETRHKSHYTLHVDALCRHEQIALPRYELVFHPTRQWRFDIAWTAQKIAIEIDGGIHTGGAHTRGQGIANDQEKRNAAVIMGWRVLVYQPSQLSDAVIAARTLMCASQP